MSDEKKDIDKNDNENIIDETSLFAGAGKIIFTKELYELLQKQLTSTLDEKMEVVKEDILKEISKKNDNLVYEDDIANIEHGVIVEEPYKIIWKDEKTKKDFYSYGELNLTHKLAVKNNLNKYIKQVPFTQSEISERIGINRATLSNIINGKFSTSLDVALKLARFFNVSVEDLFWLEEDK